MAGAGSDAGGSSREPWMAPVIAVVDDDPDMRALVGEQLGRRGYRPILCPEGTHAHEVIHREQPDLVMLDLWLEQPAAGGMLLAILELDPATTHIPVVAYSEQVSLRQDGHDLMRLNGHIVLEPPFTLNDLLAEVECALSGPVRRQRSSCRDQRFPTTPCRQDDIDVFVHSAAFPT